MASLFDRVKESTSTAGTGTVTLGGSPTGFRNWSSVLNNSDQAYYVIEDPSSGNWECGIGTMSGSTGMVRTSVTASSSGGVVVNFPSGTKYIWQDVTANAVNNSVPGILRGYIDGLILSNDGSSPNTVVDVAAGTARDSTDVAFIYLSSAVTKTLNSSGSWTAGTGNNGLDTGARANSTWYHVYVISKPGGLSPDVLFSTSATSPTMPTNYTLKRRIGSVRTDGSGNVITFVQDSDEFMWKTPVADVDVTNPGTSAVTRTLTVPTGVRVQAYAIVHAYDNGIAGAGPNTVYISDLSLTDLAPPTTGPAQIGNGSNAASIYGVGTIQVWTNTSAQVRSRVQISSANAVLRMFAAGWKDQRGKNA